MTFRLLLVVVILIFHFPSLQAQITQTTATEISTGDSTVGGHVIFEDTEKPARRLSIVLLSNSNFNDRRLTVTDNKGDFVFKNVRAGTYRLVTDFAGHTNGFPMSNIGTAEGIEITAGEGSSHDVKLRAIRGGVITGRVTYPDGEVVVGAQVNIYRKTNDRWAHVAIASAGTETDDRGIFRLYPLRAGEYAIGVIERSLSVQEIAGVGITQTVENKSLNPYFFQDASNLQDAAIIKVEAGREVNEINITLKERPSYEISGSVLLNQKPQPGISLRLNNSDNLGGPTLMRSYGITKQADKNGNWTFKNVPDGVYDLELDYTVLDRTSQEKFMYNRQQVTVAGADLTGITINLNEGGKISGTITVEGGKPLPKRLSVSVELASSTSSSRTSHSVGGEKPNTFSVARVPPGDIILTFTPEEGYFVKSLTWRGRDLLRQPLKVEGGSELSGVSLVLSTDVGSFSGRLVNAQRKPLAHTGLVLLPIDEARWLGLKGNMWSQVKSDAQGSFKLSGAPGEYYLFVLNKPIDSLDSLKDMIRKSPRVLLETAESAEIDVVVP